MKMAFIFLSLFSLSLSLEKFAVDLGQKIEFNSLNKEFKIAYRGPQRNIFLFLISHDKEKLGYYIDCPLRESFNFGLHKKAIGFLFSSYLGECEFTLDIDEGDKGSFIIYDFRALYEIKLKNIYGNIEIDLDHSRLDDEEISLENKLIF